MAVRGDDATFPISGSPIEVSCRQRPQAAVQKRTGSAPPVDGSGRPYDLPINLTATRAATVSEGLGVVGSNRSTTSSGALMRSRPSLRDCPNRTAPFSRSQAIPDTCSKRHRWSEPEGLIVELAGFLGERKKYGRRAGACGSRQDRSQLQRTRAAAVATSRAPRGVI